MKIDYLHEGSDMCPLVRLYDFDSADVRRLRQTFEALASGTVDQIALDYVESVDGTQLMLIRTKRDEGVFRKSSNFFEVRLSSEGWLQAAGFAEPFLDCSGGYQWLTNTRGIKLLLSRTGQW